MNALLCIAALALGAPETQYKLTVGPVDDDLAQVVLRAGLGAVVPEGTRPLLASADGREVPCAKISAISDPSARGKSYDFLWIAPELRKGSTTTWTLRFVPAGKEGPPVVEAKELPKDTLQVDMGGKLFTRLVQGDYKPYLYPLLLADGRALTRHWPMEEDFPGEDHDHPHQKSFWFTHGNVNGIDFWSEGQKMGKIVQRSVRKTEASPVRLVIVTDNDWLSPEGKKLLDDLRVLTIYDLGAAGRLLDFAVTLHASSGPVTLGDTKEGTFGIRLAESMKETNGGRMENSRGGVGMKACWGKPAEWVDYTGKIGDLTCGVAILDNPRSFRHPTTWHVRDYGLFAANPFGLRDFTGDKSKDGSYKIPKGESLLFSYRVFLHPGTTAEAKLPAVWNAFAHPPEVQAERTR